MRTAVGRDGMIELCCTKLFTVFFVFILQRDVSWDLCVTIHIASFKFLWKSYHISNHRIIFLSERCRRAPRWVLPLPLPHLSEQHCQPTPQSMLSQSAAESWQTASFQQIIILHSLFSKHLNSIMYAHSATRNYRKLIHSSLLNIKKRNYCSWSGFYIPLGFQDAWRETEKWRALFKGLGVWKGSECSGPGKDVPAK